MSNFYLSTRSLGNLIGVDDRLVDLVHEAIKLTTMDFVVIEGVRTLEKQKLYVEKGVSWTLKSKHLTGDAVDLMALPTDGSDNWDIKNYYAIAEAMGKAAANQNIKIKWGGNWLVKDLVRGLTVYSANELVAEYVANRRRLKKKIRLDGPHFELMER